MRPFKIAIHTNSLGLPFKKALSLARQLGAEAVEFDARGDLRPESWGETGLRQFRKLLSDLDLRVAAIGFRTRRGYDASEDLDRRVTATKEAMRFAHSVGASIVFNHIGRVSGELNDARGQQLRDVMIDLATYGHHVGAFLTAETGSESGPDLKKFIDSLPQGSLPVTFNPGKLLINGFSPLEAIESLGRDCLHVHATDGVRDLAQGRGLEVQLGRGAADFPALLGALEEFGFRGYVGIERAGADDPEFEVGQSVKYLRSVSE